MVSNSGGPKNRRRDCWRYFRNIQCSRDRDCNDERPGFLLRHRDQPRMDRPTSQPAPLAVGNGILLQITGQPVTQYVDDGASATYQVTAESSLPLTYQWYVAAPGSSTFSAIRWRDPVQPTRWTLLPTADNGSVFYVVVSNGVTTSVRSQQFRRTICRPTRWRAGPL